MTSAKDSPALTRKTAVAKLKKTCSVMEDVCKVIFCMLVFALIMQISGTARYVNPQDTASELPFNGATSLFMVRSTGSFSHSAEDYVADSSATEAATSLAVDAENYTSLQALYIARNGTLPIVSVVENTCAVLFGLVGCWFAMRFFGNLRKTGDPFRPERSRELVQIAVTVLVYAVLPGILVSQALMMGPSILPEFSYQTFTYSYGAFNVLALAAGIGLIALARIFRFGCILQQQDDELV